MRLAEQAKAGSKEAFCELYGKYKNKLYRYALYKLGNPEDAEDAVSECVLAAWQGITGLRRTDAFSAWIFRILHNCCAGHIRESIKHRDNIQNIRESDPGAGQSEEYSGKQTELSVELREALAILSEQERTIVLLSVTGGLTSREISEITSLTPGSVRSSLSRSLARMREFLS